MKLFAVLFLLLQIATAGGCSVAPQAEVTPPDPLTIGDFMEVDICSVLASPETYNNQRIKITGFVVFGFEISSLELPSCEQKGGIWVEYGGNNAMGSMYCCDVSAARMREQPLVVNGKTMLLHVDETFAKFDKLIQRQPDSTVRATLVGRFFSGKKEHYGVPFRGFGHMGCCALFVIEQVLSVDEPDPQLDSRGSPIEEGELEKFESYRFRDTPSRTEVLVEQKKAHAGISAWMLKDHRRVISEFLTSSRGVTATEMRRLNSKRIAPGRVLYTLSTGTKTYVAIVSRPYWLSFYATDPKKVIWNVESLIESPYDSDEEE